MASERLRSEFEHLATHDGLTGAFTRRAALQMADAEMQRWLHQRQPFAVLMLDADHFKQINDVYGHLVGDTVLHDIAAQVIGALRATDRLGRFESVVRSLWRSQPPIWLPPWQWPSGWWLRCAACRAA